MKKYLQEVMANPEFRKAYEEDAIFSMLVTAMNMEVKTEVETVHFLCKQIKDLCKKIEGTDIGAIETDTPSFKDVMERHLKEQIYKYEAEFGEAPTTILMGVDIQAELTDRIIVSNRNIFKSERTLFGIPLRDGAEGTITLVSRGR